MSYELIGIIILGVAEAASIVVAIFGFLEMSKNHTEIVRIQRALGGLVVQESERLQTLIRGFEARS